MLKKPLFGLFAALFFFPAYAQTPQTFGEKIWWSSAQNRLAAEVSRAVGVPHPGIPYLNPPSGSVPVKNGAIVPQSGNWPSFGMQGKLPGNGPVVDANAKFVPSSTAAALGRFAKKVIPPLAAGAAIYDLAKELGYTLDNSSGVTLVYKTDPTACTVAPCSEYRIEITSTGFNGPWERNHERACRSGAVAFAAANPTTKSVYHSHNINMCFINRVALNSVFGTGYGTRSALPVTDQTLSSIEELQNDIASKSGWPTSSSISRALADAINSGEVPEMQTPTVSGPASQIVNQSTTNNTANNTTTNTTTTNNYTYQGNQVTVNQTTITTITNNTTGETTTETTTTEKQQENKLPETPFEMPCGIAGKPPCGVKIDESGMPPIPPNPYSQAQDELDSVKSSTQTAIDAVTNDVVLPEWSWTFQLPTGCAPLPLEGYGLSLDICKFKPVIHDLMSLLWVAAGIFGLLGLARSAFEG